MIIKQLSVFVENRPGRLAEVTGEIAKQSIDMRALSIADTTHFGILRIIVNHPEKAEKILKKAGLTVSLNDVIAINLSDTPGALASALSVLNQKDIGVEYLYAFAAKGNQAFAVLRTEDVKDAAATLKEAGFSPFSITDL